MSRFALQQLEYPENIGSTMLKSKKASPVQSGDYSKTGDGIPIITIGDLQNGSSDSSVQNYSMFLNEVSG